MHPAEFSVKHQLIKYLTRLHDAVFEDERPIPDSGLDNDDYVFVVHLINDQTTHDGCNGCNAHRASLQIDVWERGGCCEVGMLQLWDMGVTRHLEKFRGQFGRINVTSAYRQSATTKPTDGLKDNALAITVIVEYRR